MYLKLIDLKDEMVRDGVTMIDFLELNLEVNYISSDEYNRYPISNRSLVYQWVKFHIHSPHHNHSRVWY